VGIFIVGLVTFTLGLQAGYSWTGVSKTLSDDYLEVENVNATYYYLNDVNITDELGGTWGALTATTLDTGQGANELYDMDQNVQTTDDVSFNSVNATSDFYLNSVNITDRLEGEWGSTDLNTTGSVNTADLNFTSEFYYNDENRTDLIANPIFPYTYIIETDGTTYTARNGSTLQTIFSGSDSDALWTSVEGVLTPGDSVYIGEGAFDSWDTMLTCDVADTWWEGSGLGTVITSSVSFFKMTAENITLRKMKVVTPIGEGSTIDIVQIWADYCTVEYMSLTGGRRGILISSGSFGVAGHYALVQFNDIYTPDDKGIDADNGVSNGDIGHNTVLNSNNTGIELYKGVHGFTVHDNHVDSAANDQYTACGAYYNVFSRNKATGTGRTAWWLGSETAGYDSYGNIISDNIINMTGTTFEGNQPFVFHIEGLGGQAVHEISISRNLVWMDNGQHVLSCTGSSVYNIFFEDNICLYIKNYFAEINAAYQIYIRGGYMGDPSNAATYPIKIKNAAHDIVIESLVIETDAGFAIYIEHATGYDIDLTDLTLTGAGIYSVAHNVTVSGGRITGATIGVD